MAAILDIRPVPIRTFTHFFRKWFWQELIFGMTTMAFGLGKPNPGQCGKIETGRVVLLENVSIHLKSEHKKYW